MEKAGPFPAGGAFAAAVSGGADSMALALLLAEWAAAHSVPAMAFTVDHALRAESAEEAGQVKAWLTARGITHHTLLWKHGAIVGNVQEQAREARYRLLTDACRTHGATHLFTAHHQDDQAETLLLRLRRGSHVAGLAAMRPCSQRHGIALVRPLLDVPKARLKATLHAMHHPWREDPSNGDPAYDRVRLRHLLAALPEAESINAALATTAEKLGSLHAARQSEVRAFLTAHVRRPSPFLAECTEAEFLKADEEIARSACSELLVKIGQLAHPPRFSSLETAYRALLQGNCKRTLAGCLVERRSGLIRISREHA